MTSVKQMVNSYLMFNRVEGRTQKTVEWHTWSLKKLVKYLDARNIHHIEDLSRELLRDYVSNLQGSGLSPHSVGTYVRSMRAFCRWLTDEAYLDVNPAARISEPRAGERYIQTLSPEDVRLLLGVCAGHYALRDRAIILVLYDCGIRAGELVRATRDDFVDSPPSLRVFGKGRRYRMVPLGKMASRELRRYLRNRTDDEAELFLNQRGGPMTVNGLGQLLQRKGNLANIHVHPHLLRHTFAIEYLRNGGDVFSLQKILGHSTLEVVRHYARLADSDVTERHRLHSPGDRLR